MSVQAFSIAEYIVLRFVESRLSRDVELFSISLFSFLSELRSFHVLSLDYICFMIVGLRV